jgi:hypothetical protein
LLNGSPRNSYGTPGRETKLSDRVAALANQPGADLPAAKDWKGAAGVSSDDLRIHLSFCHV